MKGNNLIPGEQRVADACVEHLAADLVAAEERGLSLEADANSWRELAVAAFDALHEQAVERRRLRIERDRLREELHALREQLLLEAGVDNPDAEAVPA